MDEEEEKEALKHDLLSNIDDLVDILYDQIGDELLFTIDDQIANKELDEIATNIRFIMIDLEKANKFKDDLDKYLGKENIPQNKINSDGSVEVYSEIDIDGICINHPWIHDIFQKDFKYTYNKGDNYEDLPDTIKHLIELYYESIDEDDNDMVNLIAIRTHLTSAALVGYLRYENKVNVPYLLESEISQIGKRFMKNLDWMAETMSGQRIMSDPNNNGLDLWNTSSTLSSLNLKFTRKK